MVLHRKGARIVAAIKAGVEEERKSSSSSKSACNTNSQCYCTEHHDRDE